MASPMSPVARWAARAFPLLVLLTLACDIPLHATRGTPPPGIERQALAKGARAPPAGRGAHLPAAVVFYRGHW